MRGKCTSGAGEVAGTLVSMVTGMVAAGGVVSATDVVVGTGTGAVVGTTTVVEVEVSG